MFERESHKKNGSNSERSSTSAARHAPTGGYARRGSALDGALHLHSHTRPELLADLMINHAPDTTVGFDALSLQAFLGNQHVKSFLGRQGTSPSTAAEPCTCGGTCSHCSAEEEEYGVGTIPSTEPPDEGLDEEELRRGMTPQTFTEAELGDEMTPMAFSETELSTGGGIKCQDGLMLVNIGPGINPCNVDCATKHEQKHIADFLADPVYKDACVGITNGKTFRYKNSEDTCRFETAATDVEIACLAASIPTASDACKPIMTTRKDKTLPNYKKSSCEGC